MECFVISSDMQHHLNLNLRKIKERLMELAFLNIDIAVNRHHNHKMKKIVVYIKKVIEGFKPYIYIKMHTNLRIARMT